MASSVLVPLYVYPSVGAWEPVYAMATAYPQLQFTAIINVHNGPGDGSLPNFEYSHAIGTLNSFHNVRTIGYVATTWCTRDLSSVIDDVAAYSFWGQYDGSLAIDGIFVDETPTQYSPESISYLQAIAQAVHSSNGLKEGYIGTQLLHLGIGSVYAQWEPKVHQTLLRYRILLSLHGLRVSRSFTAPVHNPGALPDAAFFEGVISSADTPVSTNLTVVFENTLSIWMDHYLQLMDATKLYDRDKLAVILHSVPQLNAADIGTTLRQVLTIGHSIWFTGTDNYTSLDTHFPTFIERLATLFN